MTTIDVAVIGGGPAGLAAALALVRACKSVVLYDCWPPRNASAAEVHGFVTQDGTPPAELRRLGREQLAAYERFTLRDDDRVRAIRGGQGAFVVVSDHAETLVRRVLLCVGVVDVLPELPGYRELWGHKLFQCPYCHAWEVRGRSFGYIAPDARCLDWAVLLRSWTTDLVVFTSAAFEPPPRALEDMRLAKIAVVTEPIAALRDTGDGRIGIELVGREPVTREVLFVRPPQAQTPLVRALAVRLDARDLVHTSPDGETSIPGIYAAGDLAQHEHGALAAAAQGARVAHALDEAMTRELVLGPGHGAC